jgi:hypothetical protein
MPGELPERFLVFVVGSLGRPIVGGISGTVRLDRGIDRINYELANRVGKFLGAAASGVVEVESAAGRQDPAPLVKRCWPLSERHEYCFNST